MIAQYPQRSDIDKTSMLPNLHIQGDPLGREHALPKANWQGEFLQKRTRKGSFPAKMNGIETALRQPSFQVCRNGLESA